MSNKLKEIISSSRIGTIAILIFSVYTFAWSIMEPLQFDWIDNNKGLWRIVLLTFSGIVSIAITIRLARSLLDKIDADGPGRTLQDSYSSTGNPQLTPLQDGHIGNVVKITGNYSLDETDWMIKSSAQKANKMELIFNNNGKFDFYLRVGMLSKNGQTSITKWIRFDSTISTPNPYVPNAPELGVPYDSILFKTFNKAEIDIAEAVKKSYGQGGWTYNKIMIFRIRCNDTTIKSVSFKK